jgi:hypothetical protein
MNTKIRILIGDNHPVVRKGLVRILTRAPDIAGKCIANPLATGTVPRSSWLT